MTVGVLPTGAPPNNCAAFMGGVARGAGGMSSGGADEGVETVTWLSWLPPGRLAKSVDADIGLSLRSFADTLGIVFVSEVVIIVLLIPAAAVEGEFPAAVEEGLEKASAAVRGDDVVAACELVNVLAAENPPPTREAANVLVAAVGALFAGLKCVLAADPSLLLVRFIWKRCVGVMGVLAGVRPILVCGGGDAMLLLDIGGGGAKEFMVEGAE